MLGKDANWVRNVAAAGGRARLRHGKTEDVRLVVVDIAERTPILKQYLQVAPGRDRIFRLTRMRLSASLPR